MGKNIAGDLLGSLTDLLNSPNLGKNLLYSIPAVIAYQASDLFQPTFEELGEYTKNKLVPGITTANMKAKAERDAYQEMKSKLMPKTLTDVIKQNVAKQQKSKDTSRVLQQDLGKLTEELMQDSYISNAGQQRVEEIAKNLINIAPYALSSNPALLKSVVRASVLSGSDSLDPSTVMSLSQIERNMTSF